MSVDALPFIGASLMLATLAAALSPLLPNELGFARAVLTSKWLFIACIASTAFVTRLPAILTPAFLNPDEAQMTAQAITLLRYPVPWRDYDGTTSGPLNSLVVAAPGVFHLAPTLQSSRALGVALLAGTLACLYAAIRRLWGELAGRFAAISPLALVAGVTTDPAVQYASELLSLQLLAIALVSLAGAASSAALRPGAFALGGAALGAVPLAKIQGAPLAAYIAAGIAVVLFARRQVPGARRSAMTFAAALAAVPVAVIGFAAASGAFGDFVTSYVVNPRIYVRENCCHAAALSFFFSERAFATFFAVALAGAFVLLAAGAVLDRSLRRNAAAWVVFWLGLGGAALYAIEVPQTPFVHYLYWLLLPVGALFGSAAGVFAASAGRANVPAWLVRSGAVVVVLAAGAPVWLGLPAGNPQLGSLTGAGARPNPLVAALQAQIHPGDRVAMWGWSPQYLVYTDAVMGTRDSISQFQIENRSFRPYYRDRYLRDFTKNEPAFLIEAIGPDVFAYHDRKTEGIESFPELARIVRASYAAVFDISGVRLWKRSA